MFRFFRNKEFLNRLPKMLHIDINLSNQKFKKRIITFFLNNKELKYFKK